MKDESCDMVKMNGGTIIIQPSDLLERWLIGDPHSAMTPKNIGCTKIITAQDLVDHLYDVPHIATTSKKTSIQGSAQCNKLEEDRLYGSPQRQEDSLTTWTTILSVMALKISGATISLVNNIEQDPLG